MNWELRKRLLLEEPEVPEGDWVWFHCASVGELVTAEPLIRELRKRFRVFLTYFSPRARDFILKRENSYDLAFPLPLDLPFLVRRLEELVRPKALILIEREMWPSLIACTDVKKILLNARSKGGMLEKILTKYYTLIVVRTDRDADGFKRQGAKRVLTCGNLKLAQETHTQKVDANIPAGSRVFVAGSTHRGEEEVLLKAFLIAKSRVPLRLVIAPRHMDRVEEVVRLLKDSGVRWCLKTSPTEDWEVMVVDTIGELRGFYSIADVTFVGGTLVPVGGHNLLEPAFLGKPVLFGPHTHKVEDLKEILIKEGYGAEVRGPEDMAKAVVSIIEGDFKPKRDLKEIGGKVRRCYLEALLSELE